MKNYKFLVLLPLLVLSSCGLGSKLNDDQAQERIDKIKEKAATLAEDENYQNFKMSMTSDSYSKDDDGNKVKVKTTYKYNQNADGDFYAYMEYVEGSEKNTVEMYNVLDDEYEEVLYIKTYDSEEEKAEDKEKIEVIVKKDNANFNDAVDMYKSEVELIVARSFGGYANPEAVKASIEGSYGDNDNYEVDISYYSALNGSFSVKGVVNYVGDDVEDDYKDLTMKSSTVIFTYTNDVLASFDQEMVMLSGDKMGSRGSVAYQKAFLKISLPNGWKNELPKEE